MCYVDPSCHIVPIPEFYRMQFNLSPPSAADMRQWIGSALVQIMAFRLFGAKLETNSNKNTKLYIHENAPANIVCEIEAILSGGGGGGVNSHSIFEN